MHINYLWAPMMVFVSAGLLACSDAPEPTTMADQTQKRTEPQKQATSQQRFRGTIVYKSMEGGFFALITKDNQHYTLRKLPARFHLDGLEVEITGSVNHDLITFTQFGELLDVETVTVIDNNDAQPPPTSAQN